MPRLRSVLVPIGDEMSLIRNGAVNHQSHVATSGVMKPSKKTWYYRVDNSSESRKTARQRMQINKRNVEECGVSLDDRYQRLTLQRLLQTEVPVADVQSRNMRRRIFETSSWADKVAGRKTQVIFVEEKFMLEEDGDEFVREIYLEKKVRESRTFTVKKPDGYVNGKMNPIVLPKKGGFKPTLPVRKMVWKPKVKVVVLQPDEDYDQGREVKKRSVVAKKEIVSEKKKIERIDAQGNKLSRRGKVKERFDAPDMIKVMYDRYDQKFLKELDFSALLADLGRVKATWRERRICIPAAKRFLIALHKGNEPNAKDREKALEIGIKSVESALKYVGEKRIKRTHQVRERPLSISQTMWMTELDLIYMTAPTDYVRRCRVEDWFKRNGARDWVGCADRYLHPTIQSQGVTDWLKYAWDKTEFIRDQAKKVFTKVKDAVYRFKTWTVEKAWDTLMRWIRSNVPMLTHFIEGFSGFVKVLAAGGIVLFIVVFLTWIMRNYPNLFTAVLGGIATAFGAYLSLSFVNFLVRLLNTYSLVEGDGTSLRDFRPDNIEEAIEVVGSDRKLCARAWDRAWILENDRTIALEGANWIVSGQQRFYAVNDNLMTYKEWLLRGKPRPTVPDWKDLDEKHVEIAQLIGYERDDRIAPLAFDDKLRLYSKYPTDYICLRGKMYWKWYYPSEDRVHTGEGFARTPFEGVRWDHLQRAFVVDEGFWKHIPFGARLKMALNQPRKYYEKMEHGGVQGVGGFYHVENLYGLIQGRLDGVFTDELVEAALKEDKRFAQSWVKIAFASLKPSESVAMLRMKDAHGKMLDSMKIDLSQVVDFSDVPEEDLIVTTKGVVKFDELDEKMRITIAAMRKKIEERNAQTIPDEKGQLKEPKEKEKDIRERIDEVVAANQRLAAQVDVELDEDHVEFVEEQLRQLAGGSTSSNDVKSQYDMSFWNMVGIEPDKRQEAGVMKAIVAMRNASTAAVFFKHMLELLRTVRDATYEYATGVSWEERDYADEFKKMDKVATDVASLPPITEDWTAQSSLIISHYTDLKKLLTVSHRFPRQRGDHLRGIMRALEPYYKAATAKLLSHAPSKFKIGVLLVGEPGSGKTTTVNALSKALHKWNFPTEPFSIYRKGKEQYWSGLTNGVRHLYIDELFSVADKNENIDQSKTLLELLNPEPMVVDMAAVEEKGQIFAHFDFVFASLMVNKDRNISVQYFPFTDVRAFARRFVVIYANKEKKNYRFAEIEQSGTNIIFTPTGKEMDISDVASYIDKLYKTTRDMDEIVDADLIVQKDVDLSRLPSCTAKDMIDYKSKQNAPRLMDASSQGLYNMVFKDPQLQAYEAVQHLPGIYEWEADGDDDILVCKRRAPFTWIKGEPRRNQWWPEYTTTFKLLFAALLGVIGGYVTWRNASKKVYTDEEKDALLMYSEPKMVFHFKPAEGGGWILSQSAYEPGAVARNQRVAVPKPDVSLIEHIHKLTERREAQSQGSVMTDAFVRVFKNLGTIRYGSSFEGSKKLGHVWMVGAYCAITSGHIFHGMRYSNFDTWLKFRDREPIHLTPLMANRMVSKNGISDLTVFQLPQKDADNRVIQPFPMVENFMMPEHPSAPPGSSVIVSYNDQLDNFDFNAVSHVDVQVGVYTDLTTLAEAWRGIPHRDTAQGDCGALWISTDGKSPYVFGMHAAGAPGRSFASPLFGWAKSQGSDMDVNVVPALVNYHMPSETRLRPTPISTLVGGTIAPTKFPAQLDTFVNEEGEMVSPLRIALDGLLRPSVSKKREPEFDEFYGEIMYDMAFKHVRRGSNIYCSQDEAFNGIREDGRILMDKIDHRTSSGWPHVVLKTGVGNKKANWLERVGDGWTFSDKLWTIFKDWYAHSNRHPPYVMFPKDELRTVEKIKAGKTRFVYAEPLITTIFLRRLFGNMIANLKKNPTRDFAIGINPSGLDWEILYRSLHQWEDLGDGDDAGCDQSCSDEWTIALETLIANVEGSDFQQDMVWTHKDERLVIRWERVKLLILNTQFSSILIKAWYVWVASNTSGNTLTPIKNAACIVHYVARTWYQQFKEEHPELSVSVKHFRTYVFLLLFGDDKIIGAKRFGNGFKFDISKITPTAETLGCKSTNAAKTGPLVPIPISDISFLKRGFVPRTIHGRLRVFAPVEPMSLDNIMLWMDVSDRFEEIMYQKLSAYLQLCEQDPDTFKAKKGAMIRAIEKAGYRVDESKIDLTLPFLGINYT